VAIRSDRRAIDCEPYPEALGLLRAARPDWIERHVRLAALFAEVDRRRAYAYEGCASIGEFGGRAGYDPGQARTLANLGHAFRAFPELEARLREGAVDLLKVALVGEVAKRPGGVQEGDDWEGLLERGTHRQVRRAVRNRLESIRQGGAAVREIRIPVSEETEEAFERCREVASQKAGHEVSRGQTLGVVSNHYLDAFDEERRRTGARRSGPTAETPEQRGVPTDVRLALARRSGGRCEVPGCEWTAVHTCHVGSHALGSAREIHDLFRGCRWHHTEYDAGVLAFAGWDAWDRPRFRAPDGTLLEKKPPLRDPPRGPYPDAVRETTPAWEGRAQVALAHLLTGG
jgi:hypothetical protein